MAFPVATWAETNQTSLVTSITVNLPSGIAAGDLLVAIIRESHNTIASTGWPTGWVELFDTFFASTNGDVVAMAYKFVQTGDAEIGASTMTVTQNSSRAAVSVARITGAHASTPPEISSAASGTSTTPDPNGVTPSWGAEDTLWLWLGCWEGEQTSPPSGNPTNYGTTGGANTGTAGAVENNARTAHAQRNLNAASEDPGSWTISASDQWAAWTMAVRPAGAGSTEALAAAVNGAATVTAALTARVALAAAVAGVAAVAAALTERVSLAASVLGVGATEADLGGTTPPEELAAGVGGQATVGAALSEQVALAAGVGGQATVAANLTGTGAELDVPGARLMMGVGP